MRCDGMSSPSGRAPMRPDSLAATSQPVRAALLPIQKTGPQLMRTGPPSPAASACSPATPPDIAAYLLLQQFFSRGSRPGPHHRRRTARSEFYKPPGKFTSGNFWFWLRPRLRRFLCAESRSFRLVPSQRYSRNLLKLSLGRRPLESTATASFHTASQIPAVQPPARSR